MREYFRTSSTEASALAHVERLERGNLPRQCLQGEDLLSELKLQRDYLAKKVAAGHVSYRYQLGLLRARIRVVKRAAYGKK